jgi:hypothetical protein
VPTLIRDGSVGTPHNSCLIDITCRVSKAWDYLARRARNAQLNRSRRESKKYPDVPEWPAIAGNKRRGEAWDYLARRARNAQLNRSRRKSKKYPEVPEWPAIVGNKQSGEFDHLSPEWSALPVLVSGIQYTQAGNV